MVDLKKHLKFSRGIWIFIILCSLTILSACRWIKISPVPLSPKQGDNVKQIITVGDSEDLDKVNYKINDLEGTVSSVPHTVTINTCKATGKYFTSLSVWAEAVYIDGEIKTFGPKVYDLTVGKTSREDNDLNYAIYIAHDDDEDREDLRIGMANAFMDEFNSYSQSQYYWSEPRFYTNQSLYFANSVDMAISFGHGSHHNYKAGESSSDIVDVSTTEFGNCAPCYNTGDLEYLVFASCQTLSMENYAGNSFRYYWFLNANTKNDKRPFTGLHMTMGFRTNHSIVYWWFDNDSEDFFEEFADNLDDGIGLIDSWQEAAGDELSFDDGKNRTAVIYLKKYENDTISSSKDDYIYGNGNYNQQWIDYWE